MKNEMLEFVKKRCNKMMIEGVTEKMILQANSEIKKESCRPLKIIDKIQTELELKCLTIIGGPFTLGTIILNDQSDLNEIRFDLFEEKGFSILVEPLKEENLYFSNSSTYITSSLWTCDCDKNFIHNRVNPQCDICGQTIWKSTRRIKSVNKFNIE